MRIFYNVKPRYTLTLSYILKYSLAAINERVTGGKRDFLQIQAELNEFARKYLPIQCEQYKHYKKV